MAEPRRHIPPPSGNGALVWKLLAVVPVVLALGGVLWQMTRGVATIEQVREERTASKEERAQSQREGETLGKAIRESTDALWKGLKELDEKVGLMIREQDRRGGRLERLEGLESRIVTLESVQTAIAKFSVELRVLQEAQVRLETLLRETNDRLQRRAEPPESPRRPLPKGFP